MPSQQYVYWLLTIKSTEWNVPAVIPESLQYLKGQREIGVGGFEHWQVLCVLAKKGTLAGVKAIFGPTVHAEPSRSAAANEYVWKEETRVEGTQFELGRLPFKRNSKTDWAEVKKNTIAGKFDEIPDDIFIRHYSSLRSIKADYEIRPADLDNVCGLWLWGEPECGKSTKARSFGEYFSKPLSKWWTNYKSEPNIILEDIDLETCKYMGHFLKIWADKFSFIGEIKGSSRHLRPLKIIVTSNYTIAELYGKDEPLMAAIKRRFEEENLIKNF